MVTVRVSKLCYASYRVVTQLTIDDLSHKVIDALINCTMCYGSKYYFLHKCCLHCDAVFEVQVTVRIARAYWHNYKTRSND